MKNSPYYIAPVGFRTHDLPHTVASNMVKVYHALKHSATAAVLLVYARRSKLSLTIRPSAAALEVSERNLNVKLTRNAIDRSHRLGRATGGISGGGKPRPIILKFVSYQDRSAVFTRKKQLKCTKIVITENLTKRRAELLAKARATASVKATWTADGRIVCLLEDGRKVAVDTENDLRDRTSIE